MDTTIHHLYEDILEAISLLQDRLYNTQKENKESRQEQLLNQAHALIMEAHELSQKAGSSR